MIAPNGVRIYGKFDPVDIFMVSVRGIKKVKLLSILKAITDTNNQILIIDDNDYYVVHACDGYYYEIEAKNAYVDLCMRKAHEFTQKAMDGRGLSPETEPEVLEFGGQNKP
jgi:hypothetical protein